MKYVFFDIECANCYGGNAKICSFGYCITDETFACSEKRDIVINPRARFNTRMTRLGEVTLAYTKEEFRAAPDFPAVYPEIRRILEGADLVIGHAVSNDVHYLWSECRRYHLPFLRFGFVDAQQIEEALSGAETVSSLDKIAAKLGIEFTLHKSDDDAYASMLYLRKLCEGTTLDARMRECEIVVGRSGARVSPTLSRLTERRAREKKQAAHAFVERINGATPNPTCRLWRGRRVCFHAAMERTDRERTIALVDRIAALGGRYVTGCRGCTLFVAPADGDCTRARTVERLRGEGRQIEVVDEPTFLTLLEEAEALRATLPPDPPEPEHKRRRRRRHRRPPAASSGSAAPPADA